MCLIVFQYKTHVEYPFVLLANRDERYNRPSEPIHFWQDQPDILAGRDLEKMGTWLGITRSGRVAALTNHPFTQWEPEAEPLSRGELTSNFLKRTDSPMDYALTLKDTRRQYAGYRLLFGDLKNLYLYSNVTGECKKFPGGLYSVSNTDDDLSKYKQARAEKLVGHYLQSHTALDPDALVSLFRDAETSPDLSDIPAGIPVEEAARHSSIFIEGETFGTVATTVILADKNGNVSVTEQRYSSTQPLERTHTEFQLNM